MNVLDKIFADALHIKNTPAKKAAPIDPLVKLQKALDQLTGMGPDRCDLSKPVVKSSTRNRRVRIVKFDPVTKRAMTRTDPLGDENLGTTTARAIRKSEDDLELYGGFVSRGQITGDDQ